MDGMGIADCPVERVPGAGACRARRSLARQRRLTAVHEAGHYVVAAHFGLTDLTAWIYRSDAALDDIERKAWLGHLRYPRDGMDRLSRVRRIAVAVAGWAAERAWERRHSEEADEWWSSALWDHDAMSPADWREAGCEPGHPTRAMFRAAERAVGLLDPAEGILWRPMLTVARALVRGEEAGSGMAHAVPRPRKKGIFPGV